MPDGGDNMSWNLMDILRELDYIHENFNQLVEKWLMGYTFPPIFKIELIEVNKKEIKRYKSPPMTFTGVINYLKEQAKQINKIKNPDLKNYALEIFAKNLLYVKDYMEKIKEATEVIERMNAAKNKLNSVAQFIDKEFADFLINRMLTLIKDISKKVSDNEDASKEIEDAKTFISIAERIYSSVIRLNTIGLSMEENAIRFSIKDLNSEYTTSDPSIIISKVEDLLAEVDQVLEGKDYLEKLYSRTEDALINNFNEVDVSDIPEEYVRLFVDIYKKATIKYNPLKKKLIIEK